MTTLEDYIDLVEPALSRFMPDEQCLQAEIFEAARYSLLAGGKRLRPALLLEFFTLLGGGEAQMALPFACALEMIHTYSLIHDDLPCMDDDDLRRGRPSCHKAFGEATALLAGDALLNRAFELMTLDGAVAPARTLRAASFVARCSGVYGMIGGQVIDLALEGQPDVPHQAHSTMVSLKTGALFRAACVGGALLAGAGERRIQAAEAFAAALGTAFQLTDDLLDEAGDTALLGKPVGSDHAQDKRTFVTLYGPEKCRRMAQDLMNEAREALKALPESPMLRALCDGLVERER